MIWYSAGKLIAFVYIVISVSPRQLNSSLFLIEQHLWIFNQAAKNAVLALRTFYVAVKCEIICSSPCEFKLFVYNYV